MKHSDEIVLDGVTYVRKEVPKKSVAREWWLQPYFGHPNSLGVSYVIHQEKPTDKDSIHVREVIPGEVVVTRETLHEELANFDFDLAGKGSYHSFLKALGFNE